MVHDSSDELQMCPTRKKTDICVFLLIFPPTRPKVYNFFYESVVLKKMSYKKKISDVFLYFFSSDMAEEPLLGFGTKEYSECCLSQGQKYFQPKKVQTFYYLLIFWT